MKKTTRRKFLAISGGIFAFGGLNRMFGDDVAQATGVDDDLNLDADNIVVDDTRQTYGEYGFTNTKVEIKLSNEGSSKYRVICKYSLVDSQGNLVEDLEGELDDYIPGGSTVLLKEYWGLDNAEMELVSDVKVTEIVVEPKALFDQDKSDTRVMEDEE